MAGKFGTKQKKGLTHSETESVRKIAFELDGKLVITRQRCMDWCAEHNMSFLAFQRRSSVSLPDLVVAHDNEDVLSSHKQLPSKRILLVTCEICSCNWLTQTSDFYKRRHIVLKCPDCYRKTELYDDAWRESQTRAQLISQNKPDVLEKQRNAQIARYKNRPDLIRKFSVRMKEKWADPVYCANIGAKMSELWQDPEYRSKQALHSTVSKTGVYHGLEYASLVELAFIMWSEDNGITVRRYEGSGIPYLDGEKRRRYYPDFENDATIFEVKGKGWTYFRNSHLIELKHQALRKHCKEHDLCARMVFGRDIPKHIRSRARRWHYENQEQESS